MASPNGFEFPSHDLYVDYILLFWRVDSRNLTNIMMFLHSYGISSGQYINSAKSNFFSVDDLVSFVRKVKFILKCSYGIIPFIYLGVPIFLGAPKTLFLQPLTNKFIIKLALWKGKAQSMMGRIQLVNTIISGFFSFSFHIYKCLVSLLKQID